MLKLQGDMEALSAAIGHGQNAIIIKVSLAVLAERIANFAVFRLVADDGANAALSVVESGVFIMGLFDETHLLRVGGL